MDTVCYEDGSKITALMTLCSGDVQAFHEVKAQPKAEQLQMEVELLRREIQRLQQEVLPQRMDRARAQQLHAEPDKPLRELFWYVGSSAVSAAVIAGLLLGLA